MDEAARQALILQKMQPAPEPAAAGPAGGPPPVSDTSGGGGGNMGVGTAPAPGEQGFSGAAAQAAPPAPAQGSDAMTEKKWLSALKPMALSAYSVASL
jgi:hypothetical protein